MIIDKVSPYWQEDDLRCLEEIRQKEKKIMTELAKENITEKELSKLNLQRQENVKKEAKLREEVKGRYIKAHSKKQILEDIEEIVDAIEKEDFLSFLEVNAFTENYNSCFMFIFFCLSVQLEVIGNDKKYTEKAISIVKKKVALWYVEQKPYLPMAHGKATDALALMSTRNAEVNRITGTATVKKHDVKLDILKLEELKATLGISTDKLLSTAISAFTQQNDFQQYKKGKELKREVSIPLKEYAQLLGYDVEEHKTSTPEEEKAEKLRVKRQLDNIRRTIKKDLDMIHACTLEWKECINGKEPRDFDRVSLVTRTAIKGGQIQIAFSPEIASYLAERNLITQYPVKLLRIDGRKTTAYYIGRKIMEHYSIDNNWSRGTQDRISISKLLEATDLDRYEELQSKDRGHWVERIKEPLEKALDTLTQEGILEDWEYTHAKGVALTDEEAGNITSYSDFAKLYLLFTPADKLNCAERIQAKQEAKAAGKETKKRNKNKKNESIGN